MTIDDLKKEWAIDCVVEDDLGAAAIRTPMLHSKYLDHLIAARLKLTQLQHQKAELRAAKGKYFRGEMTKEELDERNWQQWQYRTLKADMQEVLDADGDLQKITAREEYMKAMLYFLESVLNEIKNRNWSIRAAIDYMKFRAGC